MGLHQHCGCVLLNMLSSSLIKDSLAQQFGVMTFSFCMSLKLKAIMNIFSVGNVSNDCNVEGGAHHDKHTEKPPSPLQHPSAL